MPAGRHQDVVLADHGLALEPLQVSRRPPAVTPVLAVPAPAPTARRPPPSSSQSRFWPWLPELCSGLLLTLLAVGLRAAVSGRGRCSGSGRWHPGRCCGGPGGRHCGRRSARHRSPSPAQRCARPAARPPHRRRSARSPAAWAGPRSPAADAGGCPARRRHRRSGWAEAARGPVAGRAVLRGLDGIDQLALAHGASALETECAGQLLELRQDHAVQPGTTTLAAGAVPTRGGARHFGGIGQRDFLTTTGTWWPAVMMRSVCSAGGSGDAVGRDALRRLAVARW